MRSGNIASLTGELTQIHNALTLTLVARRSPHAGAVSVRGLCYSDPLTRFFVLIARHTEHSKVSIQGLLQRYQIALVLSLVTAR